MGSIYLVGYSILMFFVMAVIASALWNLEQTFRTYFKKIKPRVVMIKGKLIRTDHIIYIDIIMPFDGYVDKGIRYSHGFQVMFTNDEFAWLKFKTEPEAVLCRNVLLKDLCILGDLMLSEECLNKTMEDIKS